MRVLFKLVALLFWLLSFAVICSFTKYAIKKPELHWRMVRACYRGILRIIQLRVTVEGTPDEERPLLLVTNHSSYLDVLVLGALLPVRFTPKAEIDSWPVINYMCRLSECVFIDRRISQTAENRAKLHRAFSEGALVALFPESTTGDGKHVLPFRSSYFALAGEIYHGRTLAVQPAAITYTHIRKLPIESHDRPRVAWYGDVSLMPHLLALLRLGPISVKVRFLPSVRLSQFEDRKALAAHCQMVINQGIHSI